MSPLSYLIAIALGAVGALVIVYFCKLLLGALVGDVRSWGERTKLKRRERVLATLAATKEPSLAYALGLIRQAFFLDIVRHDPSLVERIETLHTELLNHIISLAEEHSRHASNLPVLEELLDERASLLRGYLDTVDTSRSIEKKRSERGRDVPTWATEEYNRRLKDIRGRLDDNRRIIESQLKALHSSLSSMSSPNEVTFH